VGFEQSPIKILLSDDLINKRLIFRKKDSLKKTEKLK